MTTTRLVPAPGRLVSAGLILALTAGCGGREGVSRPAPPLFETACQAGTPVTGNQIGLECDASGSLLVRVVIGGPSTSSDIYGVEFDLVFDSAVLAFDAAAGSSTFLSKEGGPTQVLASVSGADPGRLVVGVSLVGAVNGVQVTAPTELVVGLLFRAQGAGSTTIRFENGRAVDSTLAPIGSLSFAGQLQADVQ
jgi:hypothetical protein